MAGHTQYCRLAAGCTAVMAWSLAASSAQVAAPSPYATLVVGSVVLVALASAAEIRRTDRFEARLAAVLVAGLVVLAQALVATFGAPTSASGTWSVEAAVVVAYGACVPVLLMLDARVRAARIGRQVHPYAR